AIEGDQVAQDENRSTSTRANASDANEKGEASRTSLSTPYQGRHIALVVDDLTLSPENFLRSRQALAEYVNAKLTSSDMAAIISTGGSIASLQQFTNDKGRLLSALRRIALQNTGASRTRNRFNITLAEATRIESGNERALDAVVQRVSTESLSNQLGAGSSNLTMDRGAVTQRADADALRNQIRNEARNVIAQTTQDLRNVIETFKNLFRAMGDLPGRKIAVLLTESFATLAGSGEGVSNQMLQLIDLARRSGVSVYALDAAGLRTQNTTASEYITGAGLQTRATNSDFVFSDFENLSAARALVTGTGGQLFANTNDIEGGLERAVQDSSSYYVVGFKPQSLDNKFHRLTVSIKGRPDLVVRARHGYLAVNQETVGGTITELAAALISPIPRSDLPLEVVANVVPSGSEQVIIPGLHIGRNYLTLPGPTSADQTAVYEIVAWVFAAGRDQAAGVIKRTLTFDLAKDPDARAKLKANGLVFVPAQPLTLPAGAYQLRAVVREKSTGLVGTGYQFFEVPDVGNTKIVSMSSVLLTQAGQTGFNGTNSFKGGTEMDVRFVIYNPPRDIPGLEQRITLLDGQGRTLMFAPLPLNGPGSGPPAQALQATRITVPIGRGRYAVMVTLQGAKGKIDVERRADFVVE
ncbi:MAG TPA: VWA domain-containing protein, partial [Pyrinomonadaceae bacterium]|nr:VWA domain-containing protein [Pyrinomonadaceae bacterium]